MNPKNLLIFVATFLVGAVVALAARSALHNPHADADASVAAPAAQASMVATAAPAPGSGSAEKPAEKAKPAADAHAGHGTPAPAQETAAADKPVNTVCAICGMDVDPRLPTLEYQGKKIGFGCRMCPGKFKSDPDKYGPYYLRNEVIKD